MEANKAQTDLAAFTAKAASIRANRASASAALNTTLTQLRSKIATLTTLIKSKQAGKASAVASTVVVPPAIGATK